MPCLKQWGEEYAYDCAQTLPAGYVLCLNLRAYVGAPPVHRLLCVRPASGRPYRDPPYPGPRETQGVWLTHHPLARQVVLVRGGHRVATRYPPAHRGAEPRGWGGHPAAAFHLLFQLSAGFCAVPHQPCRWTVGEEPGWRGFALPGLQSTLSPLASTAILAVLITVWHLPLFFLGGGGLPLSIIVGGIMGPLTFTFVATWLFNHTGGSVLMTIIMHDAEGSIQAEGWVYIVLWLAVAIGLVIFDWHSWRDSAPAPATMQPA